MLKTAPDARGAAAPAASLPPAAAPAAGSAIALVQSSSLPTLVQRELERRILAGEFPAGGKLNEAAIADLLGVSRGPVREAFRALEESGLVRLEKNRGVYVREIAVEEADEIYELRALLDEHAGRRAAQAATPEDLRALRTVVDRMDRAVARDDIDAYHAANLEFHDALVALAGNRKLLATYRRLVNELSLYRRASLARAGALPLSVKEHHEILDRIAARDAAGAGAALHEHAMRSRRHMRLARQDRSTAQPATAPRRRRKT